MVNVTRTMRSGPYIKCVASDGRASERAMQGWEAGQMAVVERMTGRSGLVRTVTLVERKAGRIESKRTVMERKVAERTVIEVERS